MIEPKTLDELLRRVYGVLPEGLDQVHEDFKRNLRAVLSTGLARMDLVTREEFDVQAAVLMRTREKLTRLEDTVTKLEEELLDVEHKAKRTTQE
jgi:BMFP domain-containing protein YqiC